MTVAEEKTLRADVALLLQRMAVVVVVQDQHGEALALLNDDTAETVKSQHASDVFIARTQEQTRALVELPAQFAALKAKVESFETQVKTGMGIAGLLVAIASLVWNMVK